MEDHSQSTKTNCLVRQFQKLELTFPMAWRGYTKLRPAFMVPIVDWHRCTRRSRRKKMPPVALATRACRPTRFSIQLSNDFRPFPSLTGKPFQLIGAYNSGTGLGADVVWGSSAQLPPWANWVSSGALESQNDPAIVPNQQI